MLSVVETCEEFLLREGVPKIQMDENRTFGSLSIDERLAHAHFLCEGAKKYIMNPEQYGKANRHLTAIQMLMSFADIFTLRDLKNQSRPDLPEQKTTD